MEVKNNTPFEFIGLPNYDKDGREVFTNIVKATYSLATNNSLKIAEEQVPVTMADEFWGDPGASPVKYESELAVYKPSTDLILLGYACNYIGKKIKSIDVSFGAGPVKNTATVKSEEALEQIPLYFMDNFLEKKGWFESSVNGNGFGFYPKQYKPRVQYAGTYDDRWRKERFPFLPEDFDYRFFQAAYPQLITKSYLKGNEIIFAENVSVYGSILFNLPGISISVETIFEQKSIKEKVNLDTVILEPSNKRLILVWRQMIPCHNMIKDIRGFEINFLTS